MCVVSTIFMLWWGFCLRVLIPSCEIRVQGETDWSTGFNLPSVQPPEQQNWEDSVEHALKRHLSLWLERLLSDHCQHWILSASCSAAPYVCLYHTCICLIFSKDLLWATGVVLCREKTLGRCRTLRLDNTSPAVMIAVSRSRSLYHRLNSDVKDRLAVFSLSLYASDTSTVNLSRWAKMITKHYQYISFLTFHLGVIYKNC